MAHVYGASFADRVGGSAVRRFLAARFARLWPLHAAMLGLMVALEFAKAGVAGPFPDRVPAPFTGQNDPLLLPAELFFLHPFATGDAWNVPAWSIACEWWAYLLFPLLFFGITRLSGVGKAVFYAACGLTVAAAWAAAGNSLNVGQGPPVLMRCVAEFALGIGVWELWRSGAAARLAGRDGFFIGTVAAILLALHLGVWDVLVVPLMAALVLAAASNRGRVAAALEYRPMRWLGEISYSIYLVHWPVLVALALAVAAMHGTPVTKTPSKLEALALLPLAYALTLGLAALTYRWIEVPARHWLKRRFKTELAPPAAAPVTATGD
jgi:peptidoglycan/LPS O-acetylase OafA/YrhL